jgi:hypothetical protein
MDQLAGRAAHYVRGGVQQVFSKQEGGISDDEAPARARSRRCSGHPGVRE